MKKERPGVSILFVLLLSASCFVWSEKQSQEPETFRFVFMTDIHLRPEFKASTAFRKAIEKINSLKPLFVLAGGDLVDDATEQTFQRADALFRLYSQEIQALKSPIYHTLGNHDLLGTAAKGLIPSNHPEYGKKIFTTRLGPRYHRFDQKGWTFFILDSIFVADDGMYEGRIDEEQMNWLKDQLSRTDRQTPITIITHFPLLSAMPQIDSRFKTDRFILKNRPELLTLFTEHNLRLVLSGHVHNYEEIRWQNILFLSGGAICANWWHGPLHNMEEGFTLITIQNQQIIPQYVDYDWTASE